MKTIYIVYSYDSMPYSDLGRFNYIAFLDENKAKAYANQKNQEEEFDTDEGCTPSYYFDVEELQLEE